MNQKCCDSETTGVRFFCYLHPRHFNLKKLLCKESYTYLNLLTDDLLGSFVFIMKSHEKPQNTDNTRKMYVERKQVLSFT